MIEFRNLEKLADYIGFAFPHEIYDVASVEGFYKRNDVGDWVLSKAGINDYLARYGANVRVEGIHPSGVLCVEGGE